MIFSAWNVHTYGVAFFRRLVSHLSKILSFYNGWRENLRENKIYPRTGSSMKSSCARSTISNYCSTFVELSRKSELLLSIHSVILCHFNIYFLSQILFKIITFCKSKSCVVGWSGQLPKLAGDWPWIARKICRQTNTRNMKRRIFLLYSKNFVNRLDNNILTY